MGVNGLWQVVQPCARPTNLATLNRKRLAVDASIWIYQFLKAVRDKEGHALRNSHVVGFFRRICKLLWYGVKPVFVFDGGAPALKRQTVLGRKQRREGRREDAARTAGKLLAVQMQRILDDEAEKRRRRIQNRAVAAPEEPAQGEEEEEAIPGADKLVYVDEIGMSQQERQKTRKFVKQDAYHLPELDGGISSMGGGNDPRIMSIEELEEYARQFHSGEDINLYDFSKIDFDGDFFRSLPAVDRYNILNAARLRSRLRMGLSKEQLEDMFPDRMAFSRFQIERVKERNNLTQRLMREAGMTGLDLTIRAGGGRIAGDKDREYILVKNDGVEGGWALGVVSREKDVGESHKPIDVDAIQVQYQSKDDDQAWEEEEDFEDVPIEGLNRLPKLPVDLQVERGLQVARELTARRRRFSGQHESPDKNDGEQDSQDEDALFVGGDEDPRKDDLFGEALTEGLHPEEEADLNRAIALSLQNQHGVRFESEGIEDEDEDEEEAMEAPQWTQKAVEAPKPISTTSGRMVAHIVNNRSSAAVPRKKDNDSDSDSDLDLQAALAASRKIKKTQPAPVFSNVKNPFDGPLPFPKLDWGSSLFKSKAATKPVAESATSGGGFIGATEPDGEDDDEELEGGFERQPGKDDPLPLPPWMVDKTDIRESLQKQIEAQHVVNAEDREMAEEEERMFRRRQQDALIEIASSDGDDSDIEIVDAPPSPEQRSEPVPSSSPLYQTAPSTNLVPDQSTHMSSPEPEFEDVEPETVETTLARESPELEFEEVTVRVVDRSPPRDSPGLEFEDIAAPDALTIEGIEDSGRAAAAANAIDAVGDGDDGIFGNDEVDEFSDPEEEELLAQMAAEAEEHARFASELNNRSGNESREAYEQELKALRSQQKKDRRDADEVTQVMITECQALLRLFGIPYITAPMEAEAQCAELVRLSLVDGIVTDDSDIFLFGGTRVYKNMFNGNKFVECYLTADLEKEMSLSREQLIALAQLLGSDYTEGLQGVGPVTAVEILSEFPGQDGLQRFRSWWEDVQVHGRSKDADADSPFRRKFRKSQAKKLFLQPSFPSPAVFDAYLKPEVDRSNEPFQWGVPDVEGLRQFLMSTIGWSKERTDEVLVPVVKDMNRRDIEGTQANITRYFEGTVGVGAKEAFAPRQRAKGSKRMADAVSRLRAKAVGEGEEPSTAASAVAAAAVVATDGNGSAGARRRKRKNQVRVAGDDDDEDDADGDVDEVDNGEPANGGLRSQAKRARARG